jgi:hypothetical protein
MGWSQSDTIPTFDGVHFTSSYKIRHPQAWESLKDKGYSIETDGLVGPNEGFFHF